MCCFLNIYGHKYRDCWDQDYVFVLYNCDMHTLLFKAYNLVRIVTGFFFIDIYYYSLITAAVTIMKKGYESYYRYATKTLY